MTGSDHADIISPGRDTSEERDLFAIPIVFLGAEETPILFVNNFAIQHEQDEFLLQMGQLQPPILLGSKEERREQASKLSYVPIKVVARFGFTRQRLVELISILQESLRQYDEKQAGGAPGF